MRPSQPRLSAALLAVLLLGPLVPTPAAGLPAPPVAPLDGAGAALPFDVLAEAERAQRAVGSRIDADGDRLEDSLERLVEAAPILEPVPFLALFSDAAEAASAAATLTAAGARRVHAYHLLPLVAAELPAGAVAGVSVLPAVRQVYSDLVVTATLDSSTPSIHVPEARALGADGSGVTIAILDTGIHAAHGSLDDFDDDPATADPKVIGWWSEFGDPAPMDAHGHGTHVASTAAGTANGSPYVGVAPGAHLVGVKVLSDVGRGTESGVIRGIEWAVDQRDGLGVDIISMSLGADVASDGTSPLELAVTAATAANVLAVVANGNAGPASGSVGVPAAARDIVAVGALTDATDVIYFSSRGPTLDGRIKPDVSGPGVNVTAARTGTTGDYWRASGTSMATPHVAGVAALVLGRSSGTLDAFGLRELLIDTTDDRGEPGLDNEYGAGVVNALTAVDAARQRPFDIGVTRVTLPATVGPSRTYEAVVEIRNTGFEAATDVVVELLQDGAVVASATVPALASLETRAVPLAGTAPDEWGPITLVARAVPIPGEDYLRNNQRSASLEVGHLLPTPRWDVASAWNSSRAFVVGGRDATGFLDQILVHDLEEATGFDLDAVPPFKEAAPSAAAALPALPKTPLDRTRALGADPIEAALRATGHRLDLDGDRLQDALEHLLGSAARDALVPVVVTFADAEAAALGVRSLEALGAEGLRAFATVPVAAFALPAGRVASAAVLPGATRVSLDVPMRATLDSSAPAIQVPGARAFHGVTGRGVGIAILDTGIDAAHQMLDDLDDDPATTDPKVVGWVDFIYGDGSPYDDNGHGTHVAAIAAGTASRTAWEGVAPGARLAGVKVLDRWGQGFLSDVLAGIDWTVENREALDLHVLSMSLGSDYWSDGTEPDEIAATAAARAGMVVTVAAGNSGPDGGSIATPASARDVVAVGAVGDTHVVTSWSSRGPTKDGRTKPEVAAPGLDVLSAWANTGTSLREFSGTSMATPMVAGIAALMLDRSIFAVDGLTARSILMATASHPDSPDNVTGAGVVNALAAVSSVEPRAHDLVVRPLAAPAWASPGDAVTVRSAIRNLGASPEADVRVRLVVDGVEVASTTIASLASRAESPVELTWLAPDAKGPYTLGLEVAPVSGEDKLANNARSAVVRVALTLPAPRAAASAVAVGDDVLVLGGHQGGQPFTSIVRIDPVAGRVRTAAASFPTGLYDGQAFYDGEVVWYLGGRTWGGWPSDRVYRYDPVADVLTEHATRLPIGLASFGLAWTGDVAYLIGGCRAVASPNCENDRVYRFDPSNGVVDALPGRAPALMGSVAAWSGSTVHVVGGYHAYCCDPSWVSRFVDRAFRYDPATGEVRWDAERLRSPLAWTSGVTTPDGLYVFGGLLSVDNVFLRTVTFHRFGATEADVPAATAGPGLGEIGLTWGAPSDGPAPTGYRIYRTDAAGPATVFAHDDGSPEDESWLLQPWAAATKRILAAPSAAASARILIHGHSYSCSEPWPNHRILLNEARVADVDPCATWGAEAAWASIPVPPALVAAGENVVRIERLDPARYANSLWLSVDKTTDVDRSSYAFSGEFLIRLETSGGVAERALADVPALAFAQSGLPHGSTFQYRVVPLAEAVEGPRGFLVEAATYTAASPAAPPAPIVVPGPGLGEATLTWAAPPPTGAQPPAAYRVNRGGALAGETAARTFVASGLGDDASHSFHVTAVNDVGESAGSAAASVRTYTREVPGSVTSLAVAGGPGFGEITVSWSRPIANAGQPANAFRVLRAEAAGDVVVGVTSALSLTDGGLPHASSRAYRVEALNDAGLGGTAGPLIGTTHGVPGAPLALTAMPGPARGEVQLAWQAPTSGGPAPTAYRIYRATSAGAFALHAEVGDVRAFRATGLGDDIASDWRVGGVNGAGESPVSAVATATTWSAAAPGAPLNLRLTATPLGAAVALAWDPPAASGAEPPTSYRVLRGATPDAVAPLGVSATPAYLDVGLADRPWYYQVIAVNSAGEGPAGNLASGLPGAGSLPYGASETTSVWTGREAYVFGVTPGRSSHIYRYDPATHAFTKMQATLPGPRNGATAVWDGRYAYVFGGSDFAYEGSTMILRYDPVADRVVPMRATLPKDLYGAAAVWTGTNAVVLGGFGTGGYSTTIYRYTPATDSVVAIGNLPTARAWGAAFHDGTSTYYLGGQSTSQRFSDVYRVSAGGTVTRVGETPEPIDKTGIAWTGRYAYTFGGWVNERDWSTAVRRYEPATNAWTLMAETLPTERYAASAIWDGGSAYVFGGERSFGQVLLTDVFRFRDGLPASPRNVAAATGSDLASIALTWEAPEPGPSPVTAYRLYMGTSPNQQSFLREVGDVRAWTVSGLAPDARYYFRITAVAGGVEGYASAEVSAATWRAVPPTVPGGFAVSTGPGLGEIGLAWSASSAAGGPPITAYRVYRGTSPGTAAYHASVAPGAAMAFRDTGLVHGATYWYTVTAVSEAGESAPTFEGSARTFVFTEPGAPRNVVARPDSATLGVRVQWAAPEPDGGQPPRLYRVYRGDAPGTQTLVATVTGLSFVDAELTKLGPQHYVVTAVNDVGEGELSAPSRAANFGQHLAPNAKLAFAQDGTVVLYDDRDDDDAVDAGETTAALP